MENASSQPRRGRNPKRARISEPLNTNNANPVEPMFGAGHQAFAHAHRAANGDDTVQQPTFQSQQLDTRAHPHHLGEVMTGYSAPHSQYPEPPAQLTSADVAGLTNHALAHELGAHQHGHQVQAPPKQQPHHQSSSQQQQRSATAPPNTDNRNLFQQYATGPGTTDSTPPVGVAMTSASTAGFAPQPQAWAAPPPPSPVMAPPAPPAAPGTLLSAPPETIFKTFEDLLASVQKHAKDQGYGIVKLRASNYRDQKPTRYDLVCDRGGVKYSSTAKKRNPSTRKVDCPFRAKAVCEVQLGNQWRFAVQEHRHNHEPRQPAVPPGQENSPVAQNMRSMNNKIDRLSHDMAQGFSRMEANFNQRFEALEKRLEAALNGSGRSSMMGNGRSSMGTSAMPPANMGGPSMGNGPMANGGMGNGSMTNGGMGSNPMMDGRMHNMEARVSAMEASRANGMAMSMNDGMSMMDDESRLLMAGS